VKSKDADDARADAQAAGVKTGDNVHVGSNVRVGGKPVATAAEAKDH
jgi:hypothetical protein